MKFVYEYDKKEDEENCDLECQVKKTKEKLTKSIKYQYSCFLDEESKDYKEYIKKYLEAYIGKYKR